MRLDPGSQSFRVEFFCKHARMDEAQKWYIHKNYIRIPTAAATLSLFLIRISACLLGKKCYN